MSIKIGRLPVQCGSVARNLLFSGILGFSSHLAFADYVFLAGQLNDAQSNAELTDDIPGYTGSGFVYMGSGKGSARWTDQEVVPGKYRIKIYYQGPGNNTNSSGRMRLRVNGDTVKEFKHVPLGNSQELRVIESEVTVSELGMEIALIRKNGTFLVDRFVLIPEDGGNQNTPPVANNVNLQTENSTSRNILLSASDSDGDPLSYRIVSAPSNGQLSGMAPELTYQPDAGFSGTDSFSFRVNDGQADSNLATVTIGVDEPDIGTTNKAKVFLMAGQSNMVGHGSVADLTYFAPTLLETRDDVFIQSTIESGRPLGPLAPGYGARRTKYGVELKMGHVLGDLVPEDIYMFKASKGGTTLDEVDEWRPTAHGGTPGNLYDRMMEGFRDFQQMHLSDVNYEIAGFIWFQGWNDATPDRASKYEDHMRNLLSSVRSDLGISDLPAIIVQMNDGRGESSDIVQAAQATVAQESDLNSLVVTSDQRPYFHYSSRGYVVIGNRIAQAALPILNRPASVLDEYTFAPGTASRVNSDKGVLANDNGDAITAQLVQSASHGSLSLNSDGSFSYEPESGFTGQDHFVYQAVSNGKLANPAEVKLWVRDDNDPLVLHFDFDGDAALQDKASGFTARVFKEGVSFGHSGKIGNAAHFDGKGVLHYLEDWPIPALLDLSTEQDFSIAMWIKPEVSEEGRNILITNKYSLRRLGFVIATDETDEGIWVQVGATDPQTGQTKEKRLGTPAAGINDGNWHHVAVSFAFSQDKLAIYIDGVLSAETDISALSGSLNRYESALGDGSVGGKNMPAYIGYMDDVRMYRSAMTAELLQTLINTQ